MDSECEIQAPSSPKNLRVYDCTCLWGTLRHNLKLERCVYGWKASYVSSCRGMKTSRSKAYPRMLAILQMTVSPRSVPLVMLHKGKSRERGASILLMILTNSMLAYRSEMGLSMLMFQSVSRSSSRRDSSRTRDRRSHNEDIGMPSMFLDERPASSRVVCNRSEHQKDTEMRYGQLASIARDIDALLDTSRENACKTDSERDSERRPAGGSDGERL
ncbi:hypothetical protein EDD17DRAFT_1649789 [Pisolithus thermaeus]|nr:hypothetical protein EDD17DRAFT_1649789 [Pisolithus thermaeus]